MSLKETFKIDLVNAIKNNFKEKRDNLKVIIGEVERQAKKNLSDTEIISILKKLKKSEQELLDLTGKSISSFIELIDSYIPKQCTENEIIEWIQENIDFTKYKNKMQAMKEIMVHFGNNADGNIVKNIITKF